MKPPKRPSLRPIRPVLAVRALARIGAVLARREQVRREHLVERVDHLRDAQFLDVADRGGEVAPEVAQHLLPVDLVVGDAVELLFEVGGEVVFDVAGEEVFQEGGEHAALVLGHEPLLVDADVAAVLEHLQDRGVGRGPADAELLHALDQRGLRVARRRLGEMLGGVRSRAWRALRRPPSPAGGWRPRRRPCRPGPRVEREEAVELHHRAGGAQVDGAAASLGDDVRRWCARARRIPSGSRSCAARSARRAWPGRPRACS